MKNEVSKLVKDAITIANYKTNGTPFKPFMLKIGTAKDFSHVWHNTDRGDNDITFYGFNGARKDGYLPLGDVAIPSKSWTLDEVGTLLFAIHPDAANDQSPPLKHPLSFEWILDNYGTSGSDKTLHYWRPIPPPGYSALGISFTPTGAPPDPNRYWCVHNAFVEGVNRVSIWSDKGTRWSHNGNLDAPALRSDQFDGQGLSPDQIRIIPNTFLSVEGENMPALAVKTNKCYLPVTPVNGNPPSFDPIAGEGSYGDLGIDGKIAVVPYNAVKNRSNQAPVDSPFYYIACEPYYRCLKSLSTPNGGTLKLAYQIGTSHTEATSYKQTTGFTVGANLGYTASKDGGLGGGISASFSMTWELGNEQSSTDSSSTSEETSVNFRAQPTTQIWQRTKHMVVYSTDGSESSQIDYRTADIKFIPE